MRNRHLTLTIVVVACLTAARSSAQAPEPSNEGDGLVHASLTLENQAITVVYAPDLSSDDAAHQSLLAGTAGARVRIGTLEGHRALRIGSLTPDLTPPPPAADDDPNEDDDADADAETDPGADADTDEDDDASRRPSPPTYELWLTRNTQGWELEAHKTDSPDGDDVSIIPLTHRPTDAVATFTASVHPTDAEAGRLALRWGRHAWDADFRFDELPRAPRRPRVSGLGRARQPDTDTTAISRGNTMAERNESAIVLADGSRIGVLYWKGINAEDEDYGAFPATADGAVVRLIRAAPLRLKTDVALRFGQTEVPTGNLAPGFAGAYAIWLRKTGDGWRLAFNDEPDSWGTQHDPSFDRAEVDVTYARGTGSFRPLGLTLIPTGAENGQLVIHWGPHEWSAPFTVIR